MITEYEEDAHFCIKCHMTIIGLENYINHRKAGCSKNITDPPKSPLPSTLLSPDESFNLKADDFFSSLELRSSSKKVEVQSTSGKNFSGILTRSKTTAAIQASSTQTVKEPPEPQQSKSGKNVWIGGHQLKELGHGDNQSKLIKAVDNLERRKEEPPKIEVYEDSEEDSEEYDYDDEDSSSDDQDAPPRHHTGGKWKPSSPIQWTRATETRDWNIPPPNFTGGKWNPKRPTSPPSVHTKGKWKSSFPQKEDYNVPPPTFTGSKWVSKKPEDLDVPPPTFTGSKWVASKKQDHDIPPPSHTKGKWKPRGEEEQFSTGGKGKWKSTENEDETPPINYTKGKWKPRSEEEPNVIKSKIETVPQFPPPSYTKGKWKPKAVEIDITEQQSTSKISKPEPSQKQQVPEETYTKGKWIPEKSEVPEENYTKGKWKPTEINDTKSSKKITDNALLRKSSGTVQYWCSPCNRRLASKIVYERHLKSELHFKRTSRDREFDETDELSLINQPRRTKLTPPEHIFSNQDKPQGKKRNRKKRYEKCEVCHSKVQKYLIGKHLISHYHCRKGDIKSEVAKNLVLEHIHSVVLESPFQCSICKFYCNTQEYFQRHWLSSEHVNRQAPGSFFCILCKYKSSDSKRMYKHLISPEHVEVVSVINRSVPIVIKKINPSQCVTCGEEFLLNVQLLNHCRKFKHDETQLKEFRNDYACDICGTGLLSLVALRRHKQNVHKQKFYICTTCNLKFDDVAEARAHRTSQLHRYTTLKKNNKESIMKKCQYCGVGFGNFFLLKQHLHTEHPQHNIRCPHCGANFTIGQELTSHLRLKLCKFEEAPETSENILQCERCPFFSSSASELIFHMALHGEPLVSYENISGGTKMKTTLKYKCPVCEKIFPKCSLHAHIRQHTQERPFECKICGKGFARKNNLQFHMKNHEKSKPKVETAEKSFLCYICGANFKKRAILQQHMQIHTGKACKCPHPGCIFSARKMSEIKEHFKIHLDEKNYACDSCEYKGRTKSHLFKHMTIHKDVKKFSCPQCPFSTRNSQHLRRHLRIHTGAKPYSCPHCEYKCNSFVNLRKHVLSTIKHEGKFLYECRFCTEDVPRPFESNYAKEFKVHLVTSHQDMFHNSTEATSFVAGIYDVHDDCTQVYSDQYEQREIDQSAAAAAAAEEKSENILKLNTDLDPIVCQPDIASTSKDRFIIDNLPQSWNLVGRYDVEEASGTLIPFESDSESLFQEHF